MNERLIEALLRLCDLEKQAQEQVIAHLRDEISENTLEYDELCGRVSGLQDLAQEEGAISELRRQEIGELREEVAKARVELKALVEENERLRKSPTGWVHIRDWHWTGQKCLLVGVFEDGVAGLFRREPEGWFTYGRRPDIQCPAAPLYIYELPADPIRQSPVRPTVEEDEFNG